MLEQIEMFVVKIVKGTTKVTQLKEAMTIAIGLNVGKPMQLTHAKCEAQSLCKV